MTNYEKYRDKIVKSIDDDDLCSKFIDPKVLKPMGKRCSDISCGYCHMLMSIWFMDEYKEPEKPEVDWSKVPVDTRVYVKDEGGKEWFKRYFAKYENGKIYAWDSGYASWTASGVTSWKYAKLAEEGNL